MKAIWLTVAICLLTVTAYGASQPITVTIPDAYVDRCVDALCDMFRYDLHKEGEETRPQFALRKGKEIMLRAFKTRIINYERGSTEVADLPLE